MTVQIGSAAYGQLESGADDPFRPASSDRAGRRSGSMDDLLCALRGLSSLRKLDLSTAPVSAVDLKKIGRASSIIELNLSATKIGSDLRALSAFKNLRRLSFGYTNLADDALNPIVCLRRLEALNLTKTQISDQGLETISKCGSLRELDLSRTQVSDEGLRFLATLHRLERLNLASTRVSGPGLAWLDSLKGLSTINMSRPRRQSASSEASDPVEIVIEQALYGHTLDVAESRWLELQAMPVFPSLTALHLRNVDLTEDCIRAITRLPSLRMLDLSGSNIRDEWLSRITATKLESLSLSDTGVTGRGIATICNLRTLKELRIERLSLTSQDLALLSRLPHLECLILDRMKKDSKLIPALMELRKVKCLYIMNSGLVDADVTSLKTLSNLEYLNLLGNPISGPPFLDFRPKPTRHGRAFVEL